MGRLPGGGLAPAPTPQRHVQKSGLHPRSAQASPCMEPAGKTQPQGDLSGPKGWGRPERPLQPLRPSPHEAPGQSQPWAAYRDNTALPRGRRSSLYGDSSAVSPDS